MITLFRRGTVWWISRCEYGKQIRQSLRTRDATTAKALVRKTELDLLSGGTLKRLNWPEFQQEFLSWIEPHVAASTLKGYRITAARFGKFYGDMKSISEITPTVISAFTEDRKNDRHPSWGTAPQAGGMRFTLRALHRILSYGVECKYLASNPVRARNLNSKGGKTLPFTQADIDAMLADAHVQATPRLRAVIYTFLYTGFRASDVIGLKKANLIGDSVIRQTIKRNRVVSIRVHPALRKSLNDYLASQNKQQRASEYMFTTPEGKPLRNNLNRQLRELWKRCGVEKGHMHRFRDTFAVRLLTKGSSLYTVSKLMGITTQTADKYYTPYTRELEQLGAELVGKLDFV